MFTFKFKSINSVWLLAIFILITNCRSRTETTECVSFKLYKGLFKSVALVVLGRGASLLKGIIVPNSGCGWITSLSSVVRAAETGRIVNPLSALYVVEWQKELQLTPLLFFFHLSWIRERFRKLLPVLTRGRFFYSDPFLLFLAFINHLGRVPLTTRGFLISLLPRPLLLLSGEITFLKDDDFLYRNHIFLLWSYHMKTSQS